MRKKRLVKPIRGKCFFCGKPASAIKFGKKCCAWCFGRLKMGYNFPGFKI